MKKEKRKQELVKRYSIQRKCEILNFELAEMRKQETGIRYPAAGMEQSKLK